MVGTANVVWDDWQLMSVAIDSRAAETAVRQKLIIEYPILLLRNQNLVHATPGHWRANSQSWGTVAAEGNPGGFPARHAILSCARGQTPGVREEDMYGWPRTGVRRGRLLHRDR